MKRIALMLVGAVLWAAALAFAGVPGRFMHYPDINGDTVVFSYEGDLFSMSAAGGTARRLTNSPGTEDAPKISRDGKWIAFTGTYDGAANVYLIPIDGGVPRRVTWNGGGVQPVGWSPDGKKILYRANQEANYRAVVKLYAVSPEGEMAEPLPVERGILCSFSPDGSKMAYNRRGNEEYYWKRYKGGQYTDIWLYDFGTKRFTPITDYVGKNAYPMWVGNRMYFVSDRGSNGIANLYTYDFGTKKVDQVTKYADFDVQMPSTDGKRIVYMQAGYLHVLDAATNAEKKIAVDIPSDRWQLAERTVNPRDFIQSMAVSNDGKTAVFEARGDIYLCSTDGAQPPQNLTNTPDSRERFPQLSPDGKRVAFYSDKTGEYQMYVLDLLENRPWEPLTTTLDRAVYHLEWSPDGTKILFGDKDFSIFYLDVATKKIVKVASSNQLKNDEFFWEVSDYSWSPDSKWITYSFVQFNRNNRVFLYSLEQNKNSAITDGFYDSLNPSFDANGDYLYLLSYRDFTTRIDIFEDDHVIANPVQVMAVQLKAGQKPPFDKSEAQKKDEPFRIDLAGIEKRVFPLPIKSGNYLDLKAGKGMVTFAALPGNWGEAEMEETFKPSGADKWALHVFDMASQKESTLESTISDWRLSGNRQFAIIEKAGQFTVNGVDKLAANTKSLGAPVALDRMIYRYKPVVEWTQIFNDTWRWYRDFFYDAGMHGRDWKKMGDTYRSWVSDLSSRADLNWLLSQMVGELCVSHTYISGGDFSPQAQAPPNPVFTGLLGADLVADPSGYYRFAKVFGPTTYNRDLAAPLSRPDIDLKEGDLLTAIDGQEVKVPDNPYKHLQVTRGQKVKIRVSSTANSSSSREYEVEPIRSESALRNNRWLADNIDKVLADSNGNLGYMHIQAMGTDNIGQFDKFWRAFRDKKGLIIDVRGNGGGWTEYFIIDKLERQMVAYNNLRGIEPFRYPGSTTTGPIVVLCNEYDGSDGEAFLEHFRARKLGTVIGVPTWGGLVGILNRQPTLDNGAVEQSNNAFYGREGKWWIENHGFDPDILLDNDPASATAGKDAQLDKAIEVLQQQIKEKPFTFTQKPPYPKK
jgi:tricorn protease